MESIKSDVLSSCLVTKHRLSSIPFSTSALFCSNAHLGKKNKNKILLLTDHLNISAKTLTRQTSDFFAFFVIFSSLFWLFISSSLSLSLLQRSFDKTIFRNLLKMFHPARINSFVTISSHYPVLIEYRAFEREFSENRLKTEAISLYRENI